MLHYDSIHFSLFLKHQVILETAAFLQWQNQEQHRNTHANYSIQMSFVFFISLTCAFYPQFKASGSMCRTSAGECDLPEYCSGQSQDCPKDDFEMNGKPCSKAAGFCYNGQCPTREQHCWRLFGPGSSRTNASRLWVSQTAKGSVGFDVWLRSGLRNYKKLSVGNKMVISRNIWELLMMN